MKRFRLALLAIMLLLSAGPAAADSPGDRAQAFIRGLGEKAIELADDSSLSGEARRQRFRTLLADYFDLPWIGRFVLGRSWLQATPEQRADYLELFRDSIIFTYTNRFEAFSGYRVKVTGARPKSRYLFVSSRIYDPGDREAEYNVVWRLVSGEESFRIVDIVIEGVSMSVTQRNEYASVIRRNGGEVAALISALRDQLTRLRAASPS